MNWFLKMIHALSREQCDEEDIFLLITEQQEVCVGKKIIQAVTPKWNA